MNYYIVALRNEYTGKFEDKWLWKSEMDITELTRSGYLPHALKSSTIRKVEITDPDYRKLLSRLGAVREITRGA